ncbi:MAG: tripartite tricarboxylate transporter substrate binding protein [Variovorax sp.]|nr:tripartite tricarboxylate transporter substrate binding protein [Variovorax sp.]
MKTIKALAGLAFLALGLAASAQTFPSRPITLIVPFGAGGITDQAARLAAAKVAEHIGQPVLVENKPGANGQTAIASLKQQPADGHTLLWASIGTHAINASLYPRLNYDPVKDFEPITLTFSSTHFLLVPASSPARTVADLVAMAKSRPGTLTFASVGIGSGSHLVGELFKAQARVNVTHVPYKGSVSALPDVLAGRVDFFFDGPTSAPFVKEGKLRALAATSARRAPVLPDVPTMAEAGYPGVELDAWFGIVARAGTPPAVIEKLNTEFVRALKDAEVQRRIEDFGGVVIAGTPSEMARHMANETARLAKVVKDSGAKPE